MKNKDKSTFLFHLKTCTRTKKLGYSNPEGGIHPSLADSVSDHSHVVALLAYDIAEALSKKYQVNPLITHLMGSIHDLGEGLSQDTGAISKALHPNENCHLYDMERTGLKRTVSESQSLEEISMSLFDEYRAYRTPEALIVHTADKIEGYHKGVMGVPGSSDEYVYNVLRILLESCELFLRKSQENDMEELGSELVYDYLIPSTISIMDMYRSAFTRFDIDVEKLFNKKTIIEEIEVFCKKCEQRGLRHW